ncbi:ferritin-like domain-containing protein [Streptomyces sp. NBC_01497]|uniref:ferritin-like domain-containing protein n=1 Tax=Streptomyces sp. NBC_01497 TaxID=2903885 RepID=UPI002E2F3BE3|nr:ferritin-like protein [Streptomyces sp. NBC_01497]
MTGKRAGREGSEVSPFARRNFLASAVLAAAPAAAVAAAGPAAAAEQGAAHGATAAADTPEVRAADGSVARLLAVPASDRGIDWLREGLQVALQLELATIPPYLCGWWSVIDRGSEAARLIRRVVGDEMYHMGVVCNLLTAVGERPRIKEAATTYPSPLPGGVRPGVHVYLSGLTKAFVRDVMMAIEAPDDPLARSLDEAPGVGDFYADLLDAFRSVDPELSAKGQLSERIGSDSLTPVRSLDDVERCIETIKEQGEGTSSSPATAFKDDNPAHYYAFGEIYHGRRLRRTGGSWQFTGAQVPFPRVRPMARVPAGGWPHPSRQVQKLLDQCNGSYNSVLAGLDKAWAGGGASSLNAAVHAMRGMEGPAVELMNLTLPNAPGNYGPEFRPRF